jgi:DnaJ-class molecular chaperone
MNPYNTLGVQKNASDSDIKRAYRKLAMENHPDKGGDANRFADISNAYETLKDPQKRSAYDHYGTADPQQQGFGFSHTGGQPFDFDTIFSVFGQRMHPNARQRPREARITMAIDLADAVKGGKRAIALQMNAGQNTVEVDVPPGVVDGENIKYPKLGPNGLDLVIHYRLKPHPNWQRHGNDMHTEQTVSIWKLIIGGHISVVDIIGRSYNLNIPPRTNPGSVMRLTGCGVKRLRHNAGDIFVKLKTDIPHDIPEDIIRSIKKHSQ